MHDMMDRSYNSLQKRVHIFGKHIMHLEFMSRRYEEKKIIGTVILLAAIFYRRVFPKISK